MNEHPMGDCRTPAIRGGFGGLTAGLAHTARAGAAGWQAQAHHAPIPAAIARPPAHTSARAVSEPERPPLRR